MATRTNYFIQAVLDLIYLNQPIPNIGDAAGILGSTADGNLYAALLVGDTECDYGSYARVAISRTNGFNRAGNVISNASQLNFPKATAGNNVVTKIAIYDQAVAGNQLHVQELANAITITTNVQPVIEAAAVTITGS